MRGGKVLVPFVPSDRGESRRQVLARGITRTLLAALAALALAAAPAGASQDPDPPWPELLPPLPSVSDHQPGPVAHCRRGRMRCIDATLRRMRRLVKRLGCDHRAVFATTYYTLTKVLRRAVRRNRRLFRDRRYLAFEVTEFSNFYFRTIRRAER